MESKTHWKKNIDSRYISGEDLQAELKGLKKDFAVKLIGFNDGETYDQNANEKQVKTVLNFEDLSGKKLYKGVLLNKTAAKVFESISGSPYMEDWIGTTLTMFAQVDRRFGYVVRFKKYIPAPLNPSNALEILNNCKSLEDLKKSWSTLSNAEQKNQSVINKKEELKKSLS